MIVDSRTIAPGSILRADLCIVGAGAAGITIAHEFVGHPSHVILLESGGTNVGDETQSLYRGNIIGYPYPPLHLCRRRMLGGSTSFWCGWCRPLDDSDFAERSWVPHSGWPFNRDDLKSEYSRAYTICGLDEDIQEHALPSRQGGGLVTPAQSSFEDVLFRVEPTRFGETYRAELEKLGISISCLTQTASK